ncbi:hypothetical protein [Streptomyces albidoflavus]|uniref:hypothetical protein n=1 Tax=Streptomyces albidoflavus TaxID=1886 RepID=UPI00331BE23F
MTSRADIERHLYRAITGNRLGAKTYRPELAIRALSRHARPWEKAGVSRETWRRWSNGSQAVSARSYRGLMAAYRRDRLSTAREAQIRQGKISITAHDNYDRQTREIGSASLQWTPQSGNRLVDAYIRDGIDGAREAFYDGIGSDFFREWLHPDANDSDQSFTVKRLTFAEDQDGRRVGRRGNRRRR